MIKKFIIFLLIFTSILLLMIPGSTADEDLSHEDSAGSNAIMNGYPGLFEIRIVSPEMLESVLFNAGSSAVPLKVSRGLCIGVITPGIVYLRGDLNEDDFPVLDTERVNVKEQIGKHLIDIVYGRDNAQTDLFENTYDYMIWIDAMYEQSDVEAVREYISVLNDLSSTITFEDEEIALPSYQPNYVPTQYLYYKISIVDKDLFKELLDDRDSSTEQLLKDKNDNSVGIVRKNHLYLLNDLTGDERNHFLIRGLLFSMGFHGESTLPDSIFNPDNVTGTKLSELDQGAIKLMYGGRLSSGLTADDVKKSLGIDIDD
ncbi:hypothetical protein DLD82_01960 [Methanospirillum stamsii]|uniref:Uncharacterized protein n=2 Tax=Methanospirillum stamsii TaxID=1277351 RepID=A0A2V2N716_9EURY|nr:hypothetical protein DLD82_01960 [Methanospirillum stamsii]